MKRVRNWKRLDDETKSYSELSIEKGKIVDLALVAYCYDEFGGERQFVRWDCAHGGFHKDKLYEKRQGKEEYPESMSLEDKYDEASRDLENGWRHYKKLFILNHIKGGKHG